MGAAPPDRIIGGGVIIGVSRIMGAGCRDMRETRRTITGLVRRIGSIRRGRSDPEGAANSRLKLRK